MVVDFDPVIIQLGPVALRWYSMMYILGFTIGGKILRYLARKNFLTVHEKHVDQYITYLIISMLIGARFAYVTIYNWQVYKHDLLSAFYVWEGGLSFHGAVVGMCAGSYLFARKHGMSFFQVTDALALAGTQGLFFGRCFGNFMNGELYGRPTDSPLGMIFPKGGDMPRHPSQLYEGLSEGLLLTIILWWVKGKAKIFGVVGATFVSGYAFFRFFVEFFREPDAQLGLFFGNLFSMGQILCFVMFLVGLGLYWNAKRLQLPIALNKKGKSESK